MACVNQTQCLQVHTEEMKNASNYTSDSSEVIHSSGMPEEMRTPIHVLCALIIVLGISGNVCVIVTVIRKLQTPFYYCLASLAVSDMLSLSILPIFPLFESTGSDHSGLGEPLCYFIGSMDRFIFVCSVMHTLAVTVERYTAICWPFIFQTSFANSKFKISLLIALIWVASFAITAPYITMIEYAVDAQNNTYCLPRHSLSWHKWYNSIFLNVVLTIIVIVVLILSALMVRSIRHSELVFSEADKAASTLRQKNKKRAVKIIIMITTMFIVFMLPVGFFLLAELLQLDISISNTGFYVLLWFARLCIYLNSACNPLIYSIASPAFRKSFVEILVCGRRQATPTIATNTQTSQVQNKTK